MAWYAAAAAIALTALSRYQQEQDKEEQWKRQKEISRKKWKAEVAARRAEMILINQQLDDQITQISAQKADYLSDAALDAAERHALFATSMGESGLGGNLLKRINKQFEIEHGKTAANIKRNARTAVSDVEARRRSSSLRLRPPKYIPGANYDPGSFYKHLAYSGLQFGSQWAATEHMESRRR